MDAIYYLNTLVSARRAPQFTDPSSDLIPRVTLTTPRQPTPPQSSSPWICTTEVLHSTRNLSCGIKYNIQPLTVPSFPGYFQPSSSLSQYQRNVLQLQCQLVPPPSISNTGTMTQQRARAGLRNPGIQQKLKSATTTWRSTDRSKMLSSRTNKLKRLQHGPTWRTKKEEVYEKWRKKKERQHTFKIRHRYRPFEYIFKQKRNHRAISEAPSECPLWHCQRKKRSRKDFDDESQSNEAKRKRRRSLSQLTARSGRSRSPVILRGSH